MAFGRLPFPVLDALPLGAHRLVVLTDEALLSACGVRVMFTGRAGGVSAGCCGSLNCGGNAGDDPDAVERNRALVLEAAGAAGVPLVVPNQVHGTALVQVDDPSGVEAAREVAGRGADGVVVGVPGVAAMLCFADCLPLVIASPSGRFAVVHAGWRGAVAHIAREAACALARADACPPESFNAYIGPHIRSECFEVGADVAQRFRDEFGGRANAGSRFVSLSTAVSDDLERAGLDPSRIADAGICTKCRPDAYFSYRATGGRCGRHAAFAVQLTEKRPEGGLLPSGLRAEGLDGDEDVGWRSL